jgi:hypothetical protein
MKRPNRAAGSPVLAGAAVAVVMAGAGTAAANDWLVAFDTQRVQPLWISTSDLVTLPDLDDYGDVVVTGDGELRTVPDAATAEAETGLDVPEVTELPRGVGGEPVHQVGDRVEATLTFGSGGDPLPNPPEGLEGSRLQLVVGPGVASVWTSASGMPAMIVARTVVPSATSSGVRFETARDYLLSLPGVPDDLAAQLRSGDGSTLPLPLPADRVTTTPTHVDGLPATLVRSNDRSLSAVVWVEHGVVTVVAGSLDDNEVLSVAEGLQ